MVCWLARAPAILPVILFALVRLSHQEENTPEEECKYCCSTEGDVRLKHGRSGRASEGYVEVCVEGVWSTLCDDHWDNRDAGVICSMLGYHRENAIASKFSRFVPDREAIKDQVVAQDSIRCEGDEGSIFDCPHSTSEDCYEQIENAGVICEVDTCVEGDVRLVGGSDAKEGWVEICRNNTWGTVCNDGWSNENTLVVCTQLGLQDDARDKHFMVDFGPGIRPPLLNSVQCNGGEHSLSDCTSQPVGDLDQTCHAAGVMCAAPCSRLHNECSAAGENEDYSYDEFCFCSQYCHLYEIWDQNTGEFVEKGDCCRDILLVENCIPGERECEENAIRIVNGTKSWNGRLEVCLGGLWGAVCEDQFEDVDAAVACRNLGYPSENAFAVPGGTFGESERMWVRGVECTGVEQNLTHCQSSSPGYFHTCRPHNSTGIWCAGAASEPECTEGDISLAGGLDDMGGRVEICHGGIWGTVCYHNFGELEAQVVCNHLGFNEFSLPVSTPLFGAGTGPILLDDLNCQGNESNLLECNHPGVRVHNCYHNEEAAVTCRADPVKRCGSLEESPSLPIDTMLKFGKLMPYNESSDICNKIYMKGDYIFLPQRLEELQRSEIQLNEVTLSEKLQHEIGQSFEAATEECQRLFSTYICNSLFFQTHNMSGEFILSGPLCPAECRVVENKCPVLWEAYRKTNIGQNANCNHTGKLLEPLPYCCSGGGISIATQSSNDNVSGVAVGVSVAILFLLLLTALVAMGVFLVIRQFQKLKRGIRGREAALDTLEMFHSRRDSATMMNGKAGDTAVAANHPPMSRQMSDDLIRYSRNSLAPYPAATPTPYYPTLSPISSRYLRQLTTDMLIPHSQLRLLDSIGKGEFGIVYKAHYLQGPNKSRSAEPTIVAVKTLKGYFDKDAIHVVLEESVKMKEFDHPNVLTLFGVCVDAGPTPYIVMPFMAKGSLLSYLRKERHRLLLSEEDDDEDIEDVRRRLLDITHQIAKGMAYLAEKKFVHRDLATRNCMMDAHNVIRVSDFGLSEDMYAKNYFRQDKDASVKLPIKWMAPESLNDGIFTEKTDVWSFGVTCWEVFSGGKTPYPGINPVSLVRILEGGERLEKPVNAACPQFAYKQMMNCWNIEPKKRPTFFEIASEIDHIMEISAGYLALSTVAEREGQAMEECGGSQSPEFDAISSSVSQLIKGVKTDVGITIQLDECTDCSQDSSRHTSDETCI